MKATAATRHLLLFILLTLPLLAHGQQTPKPPHARCLHFMGIPIEGPADSVVTALHARGFIDWGETEGTALAQDKPKEQHFRGDYYGIRCKLILTRDTKTDFAQSVFVTIGPYRSVPLFDRNFRYFLYKLRQEYGEFITREQAYYYIDDYGLIKLYDEVNASQSRDIKIFFFSSAPFYKDAITTLGLRGNVMEAITTNPVIEAPVEHFSREGRSEQADLTDRVYDRYGFLTEAQMHEEDGSTSLLTYAYDSDGRLLRRTLNNDGSGLRSVTTYTYNEEDDMATQDQKIFDSTGQCLFSINLTNSYDELDDHGNWTVNKLKVVYWEKATGSQETEVTQQRTITYWDEEE